MLEVKYMLAVVHSARRFELIENKPTDVAEKVLSTALRVVAFERIVGCQKIQCN